VRAGRGTDPVPAVDGATWVVGLVLAVSSRYDFVLTAPRLIGAVAVAVLAGTTHTLLGHLSYLYRGRHRTGSFEEVRTVAVIVLLSALSALAVNLAVPVRPVPASSPVVGGLVALILMLGVRYVQRTREEVALRPDTRTAAPVLLFGTGTAGHDLLRSMLHDPAGGYLPVGLLDDDPRKRHLRIHGLNVLGGRHEIAAAVRRTGATTVIFSVSNADARLIRDVRRLTLAAGASFKTLPSVGELLAGRVHVSDIRDVQITDLLGRRQTDADLAPMSGFFRGKRVLVTGAGGSIGSELCRQIQQFGPSELIMLDRDESALHEVKLSLSGRSLWDDPDIVLADLRDAESVRAVFATRRPHVVFHAAALKHLSVLERHPGEAVKTNVWGTQNVLEQAGEVETFVNISTDKAADPTSVLGYSKRITERLTAYAASRCRGTFLSVRFGNVLGSRGSVLPAFQAQIAAGGPVTVTHPDVTRYFMTVHEAVQLVIQAAVIGRDGEALVLDMGQPVRITELARQLAEQAARPVDIVYTGLRPGEKLHEVLLGDGEQDLRPLHPLISHATVPPLDPAAARRLDPYADRGVVVAALARLCRAEPPGRAGNDGVERPSRRADRRWPCPELDRVADCGPDSRDAARAARLGGERTGRRLVDGGRLTGTAPSGPAGRASVTRGDPR
jgi:FlaA1/EpsC-like NDP-sugar epimerase